MALADIVTVNITVAALLAQAAGFGLPLILGRSQRFTPELTRSYTSLAGMVSDGFATTDEEYLAAQAVFAQEPRVPRVMVGRRTRATALLFDLVPVVVNSKAYKVTVNGTDVTFTSDGTATVTEITAGLKSAIDALSVAGLTTTDNGGTTGKLRLTQGTAAANLRVVVADPALLGLEVVQADGGIASDLADVLLENGSWYGVTVPTPSTAEAVALAAYVETLEKVAVLATQDTRVVTVAAATDAGLGSSGTAAQRCKTAGYARTAFLYHPNNGQQAGAAWLGRCSPFDPGSETWAFKKLSGVDTVVLTDTQETNAKAKNANVYVLVASVPVTLPGKVAAGEFIDVVRFRDWLRANLQIDVFNLLATARKVPFTDGGIAQLEGIVRARLANGVSVGGIDPGTVVVTVPKAADVSSQDRAARNLTGIAWSCRLAGAVHAVTLTGTITI